jgi:Ni/Co efflux regulator RcnB
LIGKGEIIMKVNTKKLISLVAIGIFLALAAGGVWAEKPDSAGKNKNKTEKGNQIEKENSGKEHEKNRQDALVTFSFRDDDRRIVSDYFGDKARKGDCPPGLAKKGNGCQPPGQAKKWKKGYPLTDKYYDLPNELVIRLPVPPLNHRYVRVAGDILMIAIGTNMVVDALEDIFR